MYAMVFTNMARKNKYLRNNVYKFELSSTYGFYRGSFHIGDAEEL